MDQLSGNKFGNFTLSEYITNGTYGYIYKATECNENATHSIDISGNVIAAKVIDLKNISEKEREQANREIELLRVAGKHRNIVSYIANVHQDDMVCIVMEYCNGGNLYKFIEELYKKKKKMTESDFIDKLTQIATGGEFLHSRGMIHRDLKTKNILLTDKGQVKLADFGLARYLCLRDKAKLTVQVGTPLYMSPEMLEGKDYNEKTDVWSLGCTCYEMATGKFAFQGESILKIKDIVGSKRIPDMSSIGYRENVTGVIIRMLSYDSENRPTMKQILDIIKTLILQESTVKSEQIPSQEATSKADKENREYLESQSVILQESLLKEIGGYKAAETLVTIKSLMRGDIGDKFQKDVIQIIGQDKFHRLKHVLIALNSIENGIRDLNMNQKPSVKYTGVEMSFYGRGQNS